MSVNVLHRTIKLLKKEKNQQVTIPLLDVNPEMTIEQIRKFHAERYPELATCNVEGPIPTADGVEYVFSPVVGEKG